MAASKQNHRKSTDPTEPHTTKTCGNRFARHPVATISILLIVAVLLCLVAGELILKTFTGLGSPPLYELSPLYGYRLKANQVINPEGGQGILYAARLTTNNLGLRAADEWDANPAGKMLFLGDSVTYGGQYISDRQLFSSLAGRHLPGWQVGNGGTNAWGVENIVGLVVDYGFSPAEVVVTCVIEGDFYRGLSRASSLPLWTEKPAFALQDLAMNVIWRINESRYGNPADMTTRDDEHVNRIVGRAVSRLKELDNYLGQRHVRHFLFILPTRKQLTEGEPIDPLVRQTLEQYGVEAHYLLPDLLAREADAEKRRQWFHDEVHLETSGHQAYGDLIGEALAKAH